MKNIKKPEKQLLVVLGILIFLMVMFSTLRPGYASYQNIMTIVLSTCVNGCLAIAVTFVIITGGIDLSVGPLMTFTAIMSGTALTIWGWPLWLCILFGVIMGVFVGIINGCMVSKMKLPAFIATMAMQMVLKGLNLVISKIMPVYFTS
ncbi:MAG: ABC transporter permease, partial [Desulfosporosinus sp.]